MTSHRLSLDVGLAAHVRPVLIPRAGRSSFAHRALTTSTPRKSVLVSVLPAPKGAEVQHTYPAHLSESAGGRTGPHDARYGHGAERAEQVDLEQEESRSNPLIL